MVVAEVDPEVEEVLVVGVVVIRLEAVIVVDTGADVAGDTLRTKPSRKVICGYRICVLESVR